MLPSLDRAPPAYSSATTAAPDAGADLYEDPARLHLAWILRLRWGGWLSQVALAATLPQWVAVTPPWGGVLSVLFLGALSNVALHTWSRRALRVPHSALMAALSLDVTLLTALLHVTGGPMNPFTFLYMAQVALACVVLSGRWAWLLCGLAVLAYASLFVPGERVAFMTPSAQGHLHVHEGHGGHGSHDMRLHLRGMWVAFAVTAGLLGVVVDRLKKALDRQARVARALAVMAEKNERLASLATLAGGAAHEFATPLGTISLAASEMRERLSQTGAEPALLEDADLILSQVARCQDILHHLAADAGQSFGEASQTLPLRDVVEEACVGLRFPTPPLRREQPGVDAFCVRVPRRALAQALRALLKNAIDASVHTAAPIEVHLAESGGRALLRIIDHGAGMDAQALARAGEPFFTTKGPGAGMGLGLYLARTLVERLGGTLEVQSREREGTSVAVTLPLARESGT